MDPPLVNEASFTAAANPSSYSLAGLLSFPTSGGLGLRMRSLGGDVSLEASTVTEQSRSRGVNGGAKRRRDVGNSFNDSSSKLVSTSSANQDLNESTAKRKNVSGSSDENSDSKSEAEAKSGTSIKPVEEKNKPEPPKDYIHVRARRGQATDSHSLAERARREKISERMKILQDLVPGCNKVIGKALVLDEIINYIQSLQHQVEFLSMKLEAVNSRMNPSIDGFASKNVAAPAFDANGMIYGPQTPAEYGQRSQAEWLHMQRNSFRPTMGEVVWDLEYVLQCWGEVVWDLEYVLQCWREVRFHKDLGSIDETESKDALSYKAKKTANHSQRQIPYGCIFTL